jgi:cell division protein FtsL
VNARRARIFLTHWTLAVTAAVCAFVVHLALRGRTVSLGYEIGKARQEQARLREVKRVLELEAASYKTPERVEIVARSLLGMEPPGPERIVSVGMRVESEPEAPKTAGAQPGAVTRPHAPDHAP